MLYIHIYIKYIDAYNYMYIRKSILNINIIIATIPSEPLNVTFK